MTRVWLLLFTTFFAFAQPVMGQSDTRSLKLDEKGVPLVAPKAAVDKVAYSYQKRAIVKLKRLLKNKKFKSKEAKFLMRLARLQHENAEIIFRIAHEEAYYKKKRINLKNYRRMLESSVKTLNRLLKKYPDFKERALAYLMRGKAFAEMEGKRKQAIRDYLYVVENFPRFKEVRSAYLALASFSIEDGKHLKAIQYLKFLLKDRKSEDYPFALYKIAWSYYYQDDVDQAMTYAKRYISFHNREIQRLAQSSKDEDQSKAASHAVMRNEMLNDLPLFYFKGYRLRNPGYQIKRALRFFRKYVRGPNSEGTMGPILMKFTKLLRSHEFESAMVSWKKQIVKEEYKRPEALQVLMYVYEDQYNKKRYKNLIRSTKDIVKLHEKAKEHYSFATAEGLLVATAGKLQKKIAKRKRVDSVSQSLSVVLIYTYRSFLNIANAKNDSRVFRVSYNLAEAYATIDKYDQAITHYQWIIENGKRFKQLLAESGVDATDAGLKAVGIRYKDLRKKKLIPADLKPKSIDADAPKDLNKKLAEWINWILKTDTYGIKKGDHEKSDFYYFEASRALYYHGYIHKSVKQMSRFAKEHTASKYAVPMASLVLDTMIASESWNKVNTLTNEYLQIPAWTDEKFKKRLARISADSFYKIAEDKHKDGKHKEVLAMADTFNARYAESHRKEEFLNLLGKAALAGNDNETAIRYFSRMIEEVPKSKYRDSVLLVRAQHAEKQYKFKEAAIDYMKYLKVPNKASKKEIASLKEKILIFAWLANDPNWQEKRVFKNKRVCSAGFKRQCDYYKALAQLDTPVDMRRKYSAGRAWKKVQAIKNSKERAIWSVIALQGRKKYSLESHLDLAQFITRGWSKQNQTVKFAMIPGVSEVIPKAFEKVRWQVRKKTKVRANQDTIAKRINLIQKVEAIGGKVIKLPWARVQAQVLDQVAYMYSDLAADIDKIPAPGGMSAEDLKTYRDTMKQVSAPFLDQARAIRKKAFEIASQAGIEDEVFTEIAERYFELDPEARKSLLAENSIPSTGTLSWGLLERLDPQGKWNKLDELSKDRNVMIQTKWARALEENRWSRVAYYMQVAEKDGVFTPSTLGLMRAVALSAAGAKAEALDQLIALREKLDIQFDESAREYLAIVLIKNYLNTLASNKIKELMDEIDSDKVYEEGNLTQSEATVLAKLTGEDA